MSLTALLRGIPIFAELDEPSVGRLAERCVPRSFPAGHVLFTTGEPCRGLYIIETGRVRVYRTNPEGKEQVLHIEDAGHAVAELPLFDGGPYPASAVTIEPTRLVFLPLGDFEGLYRSNPDIAQGIIRALARRLRRLVHLAETLAFRDVAARLALLLAGYADERGVKTAKGVELTVGRTQEELAIEIGTARESVSRAFKQLRKEGLIEALGRNRLLIPNLARLRALAPAPSDHAS